MKIGIKKCMICLLLVVFCLTACRPATEGKTAEEARSQENAMRGEIEVTYHDKYYEIGPEDYHVTNSYEPVTKSYIVTGGTEIALDCVNSEYVFTVVEISKDAVRIRADFLLEVWKVDEHCTVREDDDGYAYEFTVARGESVVLRSFTLDAGTEYTFKYPQS